MLAGKGKNGADTAGLRGKHPGKGLLHLFTSQIVEGFQREWTDGPYRTPEEVDPEVRERVRAMARNTVESVMEGRSLQPPAIDRLAELRVPMLVVVGKLDMPGIHEIANLLVDANSNAELVRIWDVAHMVNLENPEEFNRVLLEFLDRF